MKLTARARRVLPRVAATCVIVATAAVAAPLGSQRTPVTNLVVQIQRADYEGDRAALLRYYNDLAPFAGDKELGARVRYWRGFSRWRRALNGFNDSVDRNELDQDLRQAVSEFEAAMATDPNFVDAKIAAAACSLNLVFLHQPDAEQVRELLAKALPLMNQAQLKEPENPRLLWVVGSNRWFNPPERGGGQALAMETYQKGLEVARKRKRIRDRLSPSWGEPELLMNLAWSNLNRQTPDLDAAERYARSALALVPYWHYVRDILLPQIVAKAKQGVSLA